MSTPRQGACQPHRATERPRNLQPSPEEPEHPLEVVRGSGRRGRSAGRPTPGGEEIGLPELVAFDLDTALGATAMTIAEPMRVEFVKLLRLVQVCVISNATIRPFRVRLLRRLGVVSDRAAEGLHLMPMNGSQYWRMDRSGLVEIYSEDLDDREFAGIFAVLEQEARRLGVPLSNAWGPAVENLGPRVRFSALGSTAAWSAKTAWDLSGEKRRALCAAVEAQLPGFEARVHGPDSVEVTRAGMTNAHGLRRLSAISQVPPRSMLFIGGVDLGGEHFAALRALGVETRTVYSWHDTRRLTATLVSRLSARAASARATRSENDPGDRDASLCRTTPSSKDPERVRSHARANAKQADQRTGAGDVESRVGGDRAS